MKGEIMIDKNWLDAINYDIYFENESGNTFLRNVIVPFEFLERDIETYFCNHFKEGTIKIISIKKVNYVWLSKSHYKIN
ncbi:hypothetical protein [Carnobacterium divergens]|uniref:hypothetical protein n=2 Tax=Carnobacterium divergens TaxID=2748 RepID=UPI00186B6CE1|nr:hypothetical protein [Carnobacterium divergens]